MSEIKNEDYARFHTDYIEDTDLCLIADHLADQYGDAGSHVVWLYWPRMIAAAKAAKTFGWFSTTPRRLAQSIGDGIGAGSWAIRVEMWTMLADAGLIQIRQGSIGAPSAKVDVLLTEWEKWQVDTGTERKKLERERRRVEHGETCHWTVAHLVEFRDGVTPRSPEDSDIDTDSRDKKAGVRDGVTLELPIGTPHYITQQDKEGPRESAPPSALQLQCEKASSTTGLSIEWWISTMEHHRSVNQSAPEEVFVEALHELLVTLDGARLSLMKAMPMARGFVSTSVKRWKEQTTKAAPGAIDVNAIYANLPSPGTAA
jgi:hypothetical protein